MRHRNSTIKLSRKPAHTKALLKNLAISFFLNNGRMETTKAKAKAIQPFVEKLITIAKKKEEHLAVRELKKLIANKEAVTKLVKEFKVTLKDKEKGYTQIHNIGFRTGDGAAMAVIELTK